MAAERSTSAGEIVRTLRATDGAVLAYRLWRPGPPRRLIVLVHGLASNHTRWSEFVMTTRLRESWDLLRVDLRGFEGSVTRDGAGLDGWCRDLSAIIAAEGGTPAVMIGHCLGANIVLHLAARSPACVAGLVLIESMFPEALTGRARLAIALRPAVATLAAVVRGLNHLGLYRRHLQSVDLEQLDREARAAMADARGFPMDRYASPLEDLKYTPTAVYLAGLLAVTAPSPDLRRVQTPVLALLSSGGQYGDPEITARVLSQLPRCETRRLAARHWIPTECPVDMGQAIQEWCDRLPA